MPLTLTTWSGGTGTTYYYHENGHGDVVALTDSSGNTVAQYSYDAWGNILTSSGTMASTNPYLYAGYRWDNAIGMYYLNARYYAPNLMRFISKDPVSGLNAYAYADDNPVLNVDPSGEWTLTGVFGAIDSIGSDLLSTVTDAVSGFLDGIEGGPWAAAGAIYGVIKSSTITITGGDLPYSYASSGSGEGSKSLSTSHSGISAGGADPGGPRRKTNRVDINKLKQDTNSPVSIVNRHWRTDINVNASKFGDVGVSTPEEMMTLIHDGLSTVTPQGVGSETFSLSMTSSSGTNFEMVMNFLDGILKTAYPIS